ncbi:MAG: hemerythrin family protein [SAR324 cluster bacterium]|nr:hemerythrin family protein [SAR324 cluster bacterium]
MNIEKIEWTEDLATGVILIDEQHQELFARIDKFMTVVQQEKINELQEVIAFLEDYVFLHFDAEEEYMNTTNYPGYSQHQSEHAKFIKSFNEIKHQCDQEGEVDVLVDTIQKYLVDWLINHIQKTDQRFAAFMKNHF